MDPEKITLDLGKFDPTQAELTKMVEATRGITATDLKDKAQLEIVKQSRITLKNARVQIEKTGKSLRDPATAFSKKVSAREKELVAIIEPEEERLAAIEEEAKQLAIREERMEKLPARKERLDQIIGESPTPMEYAVDSELLEMDAEAFESYFNQKMAEKNENVRLETERLRFEKEAEFERTRKEEQERIDAENARIKAEQDAKQKELDDAQRKIDDEKREIQHQKEVEAAAKKAREDAEREAKEAAEKKEADRIAEEKRIKEEKEAEEARLKKEKKFIEFKKSIGYTEKNKDEFWIQATPTGFIFYKKVGEYDSSN